jgi:hypothetical protein
MTVKSYINKGNSFPIIIEDKGKNYFVKLQAGMSGKHALVSEWIGTQLGNQIGIPTQIPHWIELNSNVEMEAIHIEVRDLIGKSLGTNIGFPYLKEAKDVRKEDLESLEEEQRNEIFLFDLMMINIDRTPSNINLMDLEGKLLSVDYESSLLVQELIENKKYLEDERILKCFRHNPLYQEMSEETIDRFIEKVKDLSVERILAEIPLVLLSRAERALIVEGIELKKRNEWHLKGTMDKLRSIKIESKKEHRRRINRNQAEFKRRFRENLVKKEE